MLLAESHVSTTDAEVGLKLRYPQHEAFSGLPDEFVKLVYCLGYGEPTLVPDVSRNLGTSQYWKIFAACTSDNPEIDCGPILKSSTSDHLARLLNKVALLRKLRDYGVWLVDCSIVGLYDFGRKVDSREMKYIIPFCWDNYISNLVERERPGHIIVVGYKIADPLWERLYKTRIPFTKLPQPQAHLPAHEHEEAMRTYQAICNKSLG